MVTLWDFDKDWNILNKASERISLEQKRIEDTRDKIEKKLKNLFSTKYFLNGEYAISYVNTFDNERLKITIDKIISSKEQERLYQKISNYYNNRDSIEIRISPYLQVSLRNCDISITIWDIYEIKSLYKKYEIKIANQYFLLNMIDEYKSILKNLENVKGLISL